MNGAATPFSPEQPESHRSRREPPRLHRARSQHRPDPASSSPLRSVARRSRQPPSLLFLSSQPRLDAAAEPFFPSLQIWLRSLSPPREKSPGEPSLFRFFSQAPENPGFSGGSSAFSPLVLNLSFSYLSFPLSSQHEPPGARSSLVRREHRGVVQAAEDERARAFFADESRCRAASSGRSVAVASPPPLVTKPRRSCRSDPTGASPRCRAVSRPILLLLPLPPPEALCEYHLNLC